MWVGGRVYKRRLPAAGDSSAAGRCTWSDAGRHDVGADVISDVSLQQQQHHLHSGRLDSFASARYRRRDHDCQSVSAARLPLDLQHISLPFIIR